MFNLDTVLKILFGKPQIPYIPNLRMSREDRIFFESLTRGMLLSGNPSSGKTTFLAMKMVEYALTYPDRPVFSLDASGSLTNEFIELVHLLPAEQRDSLLRRIVLDIPGHEKWVVPKPMFDPECGLTDEEQVQKAVSIGKELNPNKMTGTPMMADSLETTAPMLYRLLMVIKNEHGESWQITEAKKFLINRYEGGDLHKAIKRYGGIAPEAKFYFENTLLRNEANSQDVASWTKALMSALAIIEPKSLRARYGYYKSGVTAKEVIDKGLIYLVSGEKLANQENAQAFVFWDEFVSLRSIINKRTPHDPLSKPVLLVIDEVYRLFEIEGMAKALGEISTYFRNRKLMPIIVIQAYWQLTELLKEQIWNLGNIYSFAMENQKDAYALAQQLFRYDKHQEKWQAPTDRSNPTAESDRGQYLSEANWIQNLKWRQMIMRRYLNERDKEQFVQFVERTAERPTGILPAPIEDLKDELLKKRAVTVEDALEVINKRKLPDRQVDSRQADTQEAPRPTAH